MRLSLNLGVILCRAVRAVAHVLSLGAAVHALQHGSLRVAKKTLSFRVVRALLSALASQNGRSPPIRAARALAAPLALDAAFAIVREEAESRDANNTAPPPPPSPVTPEPIERGERADHQALLTERGQLQSTVEHEHKQSESFVNFLEERVIELAARVDALISTLEEERARSAELAQAQAIQRMSMGQLPRGGSLTATSNSLDNSQGGLLRGLADITASEGRLVRGAGALVRSTSMRNPSTNLSI